jgi:hypothetical protein
VCANNYDVVVVRSDFEMQYQRLHTIERANLSIRTANGLLPVAEQEAEDEGEGEGEDEADPYE